MRDCIVKIGNDGQATVSKTIEYIEEHSATRLVITLNSELKSSEISYYTLCFKPGAALKNPPDIKITSDMISASSASNGTISYALPSELTCFGSLDAQVQAHIIDSTGRMASLIKSPVFRLEFEPSITGDEEILIGEGEGFISLIHSALAQLNLTVEEVDELCDKLNEAYENGELNGPVIMPSVSEDGTLSWSNDAGFENPTPVNIKGPKGDKGEKGEKGDKGDKGDKGEPAKINGYNAVTLEGGECCRLTQNGDTLTLDIDGVPVLHTLPETANDGDICLYSPANVLNAGDSGKKIHVDWAELYAAMTNENAQFITEFIDADGNECGNLNAYAYGNDQGGIDNVFQYIKGNEEWFVTFSNGVFLPEESYYSKGESITPLDKPPESFVLPAFTRTQVISYDTNGDIFYAPLKLMAYRGGWYPLISVEGTSLNGEFVTNDQFVDITCLLEQAIELNRIKSEFALRIINVPTLTQLVLEPWQYYNFGKVESLTLELAEADSQFVDFLPEYSFTFISGATPTVLTLPSSVQWVNELTVEANKRYEISIVDNIGLWCAVDYEVSE